MGSKVTYREDPMAPPARSLWSIRTKPTSRSTASRFLTHLGAALIGLSAGQRIEFRTPGSGTRCITVLVVSNP